MARDRLTPTVEVRRVYDKREPSEGDFRALVDRLWPRGISKASLRLDEWAKEVAPSTELRRWYGHDPDRFDEFARRYRAELEQQPASDALARLVDSAATGTLVLLTATKDVEHSGAAVLREFLVEDR